jgi:DNA (cytosine-5)-methyltransferase 1
LYNFIDLFAGIGGFHLALAKNGMKCVFASEIDAHARSTYLANHSIAEKNFNTDIRSISPSEIPEHDILCAGFPCQPFSQAGHKKGFDDGDNSERGNLFYCILDILEEKKPKAFILENVRHLLKHDNGKTFNIIYDSLTKAGYTVDFKIIKASEFGRPQHRPRIYIVGFNKELVNTESPFLFPKEIPLKLTMSDIWEGQCNRDIGFTLRVGGRGSAITDRRNWDSYLVNGKITRLSPKQGKRMMGLPDTFIMPVTETQQMKQLGNSVCVDVIYHISKAVKEYLDLNIKKEGNCMSQKLNKGEWSEIYAFFKLIIDNILPFGDSIGEPTSECITIFRIKHNQDNAVYDIKDGILTKLNTSGEVILETPILQLLSHEQINIIWKYIMNRDGSSFDTPIINDLLTQQKKQT